METVITVAKATARKCKVEPGWRVDLREGQTAYKPIVKVGKKTTVLGRATGYEQGILFATKEEAAAFAQTEIDSRRAQAVKQAHIAHSVGRFERRRRWFQGAFETWGGTGPVLEASR